MSKTDTGSALTRREREIMDILHRRGKATAHEVLAEMAEPPSYSAVRTFLRLLEERGHVTHQQDGQRYVYSPKVERVEARRSALSHLVQTFFSGSVSAAVTALVESSKDTLSQDELDHISKLIEQ
ncbi:MAG: BlaI/MecI/CopY family transcriptional regulator, partial [Polyangiaceae bacterium]